MSEEKGTLYIVGTPIGNMEDVTLRALRVLKDVDIIVCEDTRVTKKLLSRYDILTPTLAYHRHSAGAVEKRILDRLERGESVALVTDAGTPGVSDPGPRLVAKVWEAGMRVAPIPGVSAVTALVSVAGLSSKEFSFYGFVPHKKGRQTFFERIFAENIPAVYYDSPHRLLKNLELLREKHPDAFVVVGRELTKVYEEVVCGDVRTVLDHFGKRHTIKGECVVIVWKKSDVKERKN